MSEVLAGLAAVMQDVRAVTKADKFNGGNVSYAYRGVDRVVLALSDSIRKHGLVILPSALGIPAYQPVTTAAGKPAQLARVLVTYDVYAQDGSTVSFTVPGEATDSADKAVSKAMSVAWRTGLLQAFFLPTEEPDPDSEYVEVQQNVRTSPAAAQRLEQRDALLADWHAAIDAVVGDYDALGKLMMDARAKKAEPEILNRIKAEGNKAKP